MFFNHKKPTDISKLNMGMKIVNIKITYGKLAIFHFNK
ncbi:hypothetical protein J891_1935 [Acinetobacter baumannii 44327_8]|uniref:Uncharacterized protein n=1 Tax=Acinetobacter baumannii 1462234 TaxID=1310646 RepID=A0A9P2XJ63_ACIBA|nr:hypothetical protein ACIN5032_3588 [Acinetobacter baumannii OIFC032]EKA65334.1 hypothetical protein ACINIS143_0007 [Acinetobacter baumannii IS-143]EKP41032.1 hypothetical protein ACIN5099_0007 [Acinetobacter baumannii OIFC099]EKP56729.1 hypothetical protein ACINNAV2_0007 [Acinetobacter baumannii Naval-2]ELX01168.1 hypothetical protein ACINNAV78_0007 [Acinetobacter baumannii Naval-78]ETR11868.1 hypothetical protein P675_1751 [Acinetobacter baumannii UH7007]EXA79096.1 hypothetical protein J5